jgi:hypothetical protein
LELLAAVGQAEAIAAFLQAELDSDRFAPQLDAALAAAGEDEPLVRRPDLRDAEANRRRHELLFAYRGGYLGAWFDELVWSRAALTPDEVLAIRYIAWDWWLEITGGTRLPSDGAAWERANGGGMRFRPGCRR